MKAVQKNEEIRRSTRTDEDAILHLAIKSSVVLRPGETPSNIMHAHIVDVSGATAAQQQVKGKGILDTAIGMSMAEAPFKANGLLITTNERFLFLQEMKEGTDYRMFQSFEIPTIIGVSVSTTATLSMQVNRGSIVNYHLSDICEIQRSTLRKMRRMNTLEAQQALSDALKAGLQYLDNKARKDRVQYVLDFSFLKDAMAKGGVMVQQIKCPSCGASVALPQTGNSFGCQYCNSEIYAQDVFEKMKGLIGGL
jgi:DNA-directed RNA polymerase subunit RPC12/RpoP